MENDKIAFCSFGYLRSFKKCNQNLINNVIKPLNADVFICAPDQYHPTTAVDPWYSSTHEDAVDPDYIKQIFGPNLIKANIYKYDVNVFKNKVIQDQLPERNFLGQYSWRIYSMMYHIKKVLELKSEYENLHNFKYKWVILSRCDLWIFDQININVLEPTIVNFPNCDGFLKNGNIKHGFAPVYGHPNVKFCDHVLISNSRFSDRIAETYDNMSRFVKQGIICNNETLLAHNLISHGIPFGAKEMIQYQIVREPHITNAVV